MWEILLSAIISSMGVLWGFLGVRFAVKKYLKPEIILEISDMLIDDLIDNVENQKKIYLLGGLLGQGIKQGIGLPKGTGKFKIQDAIGHLIVGFTQSMLQKAVSPQGTPIQETIKQTLGS